jgi:hypothetical protein
VAGQADLFQVVGALGTTGRLARRLHGREQQGDQYGDDGDHHQQLDQREATMVPPPKMSHGPLLKTCGKCEMQPL